MSRFILRRLGYMLVTMLLATLLVFVLSRIVGDPRLLYVQEGGYGLSEEAWEAMGIKLHLDKPVVFQYGYWLSDAVRGDLGESMLDRKPVMEIMLDALPRDLRCVARQYRSRRAADGPDPAALATRDRASKSACHQRSR